MRKLIGVLALALTLITLPNHSLAEGGSPGHNPTPIPDLIQSLFPKATRIEGKQDDYPVYPVYQLSELLGYAYESKDISDLPGFSGKPIRLLVGIDPQGGFAGVRNIARGWQ